MGSLATILYAVVCYIISVTSADDCIPIFVRWNRVRLNLAAKHVGQYTLQECAEACSKNQLPRGLAAVNLHDCSGFNYKPGDSPSANECQLYESNLKISIDDHVEADDRYSYYWKYCADKFYFSDPAKKSCKSVYHFDFHIDRYMDLADVERTIRTDRIEDCLNCCLDEPAFMCRSASFNRTGRLCSLSPHSQVTKPTSLRVNNNPNYRIDYYENSCVNASDSFEFRHDCRDNGIVVSVDSKFPYSGALYGLYDFFMCRIEPKDETKFAYFFPKPSYSKNCSDSYSQKDGQDVLDIVLSTDGMEPLYFLTDQDTMYQAKCPISQKVQEHSTPSLVAHAENSTVRPMFASTASEYGNTEAGGFFVCLRLGAFLRETSTTSTSTLGATPSTDESVVCPKIIGSSVPVTSTPPQLIAHSTSSTKYNNYTHSWPSFNTSSAAPLSIPPHPTSLAYIEQHYSTTVPTNWTFPQDAATAPSIRPELFVGYSTMPEAISVLDLSHIFDKPTYPPTDSLHSTVYPRRIELSSTLQYAELVVTPTPATFSSISAESSTLPFLFEASSSLAKTLTDSSIPNFINRRKIDYTTPRAVYHQTIFTVPDHLPSSSSSSSSLSSASAAPRSIIDKIQEATNSNSWKKDSSDKSEHVDSKGKSTSKFETFVFELPSTANVQETTGTSTENFLDNESVSSSASVDSAPGTSLAPEGISVDASTPSEPPPVSTAAPSQQKVLFGIYHNNQPVNAVVVASRIVLSLTPAAPLPPGSYINVVGCQVEPINSPYASERDPIQIISGGCQADGVGLVCPPVRTDSGEKIEMEALRYTHTSEILFSCLVRICSFGRCLQPICRPVDGCLNSPPTVSNPFQFPDNNAFGGFKNLALQRHKRQPLPSVSGQPFLPLVPSFEIPGALRQAPEQLPSQPLQILQRPQQQQQPGQSFSAGVDQSQVPYFLAPKVQCSNSSMVWVTKSCFFMTLYAWIIQVKAYVYDENLDDSSETIPRM